MPSESDDDFDDIEELPPKMLGKRKYSSAAVVSKKARATRTRRRTMTAMLLSREPKYVDVGINTLSLTTTPQIFNLNDVAQGDNYNNRQGNVVQSKYLQFRYSCNMTNSAVAQCSNFKAALVLDRSPNGVAPTFAQVFDTSVSALAFAMKNVAQNQDRFVLLHEHIGVAIGNTGGDTEGGCIKGYINLGKLNIPDQITRYNGTIATSPNNNGYYLMIVSTSTTAGDVRFIGSFRYVFNEQ